MIQREMFQLLEAELQDLWGFLPQAPLDFGHLRS